MIPPPLDLSQELKRIADGLAVSGDGRDYDCHRLYEIANALAAREQSQAQAIARLEDERTLQAEAQAVKSRCVELEAQWGVMARACGNWREFNATGPNRPFTEWETLEFQAAARAILERDALQAEAQTLRAEIEDRKGDLDQLALELEHAIERADAAEAETQRLADSWQAEYLARTQAEAEAQTRQQEIAQLREELSVERFQRQNCEREWRWALESKGKVEQENTTLREFVQHLPGCAKRLRSHWITTNGRTCNDCCCVLTEHEGQIHCPCTCGLATLTSGAR
ncbi:MAG: hypothetical protein GEV06_19895 [Luteitalea sp.]|nr:hypothetical protein [Luteitalea sp.]